MEAKSAGEEADHEEAAILASEETKPGIEDEARITDKIEEKLTTKQETRSTLDVEARFASKAEAIIAAEKFY